MVSRHLGTSVIITGSPFRYRHFCHKKSLARLQDENSCKGIKLEFFTKASLSVKTNTYYLKL